MSDVITLSTGETETIHGTFAGAESHIAMKFGAKADAWNELTDDKKKRSLASAVRYLNEQTWSEDADTFAERDAITAFATAQYELAVLIVDDDSLTDAKDQGSNIAEMGAGSARLKFFNPTTRGADPLPPVLMRLVGEYLAASTLVGPDGGESYDSDEADNPFSSCEDYDREGPY